MAGARIHGLDLEPFQDLSTHHAFILEKRGGEPMSIEMDPVSTALQGLQQAEANLEHTANRLARLPLSADGEGGGDVVSLSDEMVALLRVHQAFDTNLKVIRAAEEMQKKVIDLLG
jgi:flagellar basal body rod protein FlgF